MTSQAITTDINAAEPGGSVSLTRTPLVWAVLTFWGLAVTVLASRGIFDEPPGSPPAAIIIAAAGPVVLFLSAYALLSPLRRWVASLDLAEIIALQAWRVAGFGFLLIWGLGHLPTIFALPAGVGDVAVGLAAPAVALGVARQTKGWRTAAYGLTAAGLLDFTIAFATGILSREGALLQFADAPSSMLLGTLPVTIVPSFLVPAFLILHVMALIKLRQF